MNWLETVNTIYNALVENAVNIGVESDNIYQGDTDSIPNNSLIIDVYPNGLGSVAPEYMLMFKAEIELYCHSEGATPAETINNEMSILTNALIILQETIPGIEFNGIRTLFPIDSRNINDLTCVAECSINYTVQNEL